MSNRTYSEDEISLLLERAADLQAQQSQRKKKAGLTFEELSEIAKEAGLDPRMLKIAADELDEPQKTLFQSGSGTTKTHNHVERWIPGELSEEVVEEVIMQLKHQFDSDWGAAMGMPLYGRGNVEQIGRAVEWRHTSGSGVETKVMMRPRADGIQMRLSQRVGMAGTRAESIFLGSIPGGITGLILGAVLKTPVAGIAAFIASWAIFAMLIAYWDVSWRGKKHKELKALGDELAEIILQLQPDEELETAGTLESADSSSLAESREGLLDLKPDDQEERAPATKRRDRA